MAKQNQEVGLPDRRQSYMTMALWAIGIVIFIVFWLVVAKLVITAMKSNNSTTTTSTNQVVPDSLLAKVTSIPAATFMTVGAGSSTVLPQPITASAVTKDGKPQVIYVGAEYCPYCATERWPMVIALSRFGTFSNLHLSHSSTTDVYPNTQTFSFHGATYSSQYLDFQGIETISNIPQGSSYAPLDTPSAEVQKLVDTYDAAPYVPAASAGSIPFIDFGGKYIVSGSTYSPVVLQGKTADQIASVLSTASDPISQGAVGAANALTATLCTLTKDQPSTVCATPVIKALESQLSSQSNAGK